MTGNLPNSEPMRRRRIVQRRAGMRRRRIRALVVSAVLLLCLAAWPIYDHFHLVLQRSVVSPMDGIYPFEVSPNFNSRPLGTQIDCIVLHATAQDSLQETENTFRDVHSGVSAHFVVGKDGAVVQMVPVALRAWHAGVSQFDGVAGVNDYSIGIEMVNRDDGRDPYTAAQYDAVAKLIAEARAAYDIPDSRIVSHAQIALPPGRKEDPRGFDFARLKAIVAALPPANLAREKAVANAKPRVGLRASEG